ncbi:accessory factor associated with RNA polymerase II [Tulasnella sp. JGI-2019a]|nr:accessory factor associated with RNA polymerase II [Tulasnella sp. JGI-2019a]
MTDPSPSRPSTSAGRNPSNRGSDLDIDRDSSLSPSDEHDNDHNDDDDDDEVPPARPSTGTLRVLARGNACLCCRRRKLKCDGTKPACGPCTRGRRTNECVYEEAKVKTKTQMLQSRIRELESKIRRMAEKEKKQPSEQQAVSLTNVPLTTSPEPSPVASFPATSNNSSLRTNNNASSSLDPTLFGGSSMDTMDNLPGLFGQTESSSLDSFTGPSWGSSSDFPYVQSSMSGDQLSTSNNLWSDQSVVPGSTDTSSWLGTMPTQDATSVYSLGPAAFPISSSNIHHNAVASSSTSALATVSPSNLGLLVPPSVDTSNSAISSPSLSSAMTTGSLSSSVSSPPSVSWEDDLRLSALDLSRQLDLEDVPAAISQELLHVFLQHRRQCAFEVHTPRFVASLALPPAQRPHPALLNAIYLLGSHFSKSPQLSQYEALFLTRTRRGINHALENADRLLDFLQASCLLAWYFFFKGRLLEGHYHASAAARFAISSGLHLLKVKPEGVQGTLGFFNPPTPVSGDRKILAPPEDSIALGERVNLFWSIFLADRTGAIGTGLPVVIRDEDVEASWPRRFEDFTMPDFVRPESNSLRSLYEPGNPGAYVKMSDSLHAIKSKAIALNERACQVATLLEADPLAVHNPDFWPQFDSIDAAIHRFIESLPPIIPTASSESSSWEDEGAFDKCGQKSTASPSLVLAYTAAYGAMIQLHRMFGSNDAGSYKRCLAAAMGAMKVVRQVETIQPRFLPMTLGIIWTSIAEVLAVEHERLRRREAQAQLEDMEMELTTLFNIMRELRTVFPILTLRINKVPFYQGCQAELDAGLTPAYVLLSLRAAIRDKQPISYLKNGTPCSSISEATHIAISPNLTLPKTAVTRWRRPLDPSAASASVAMDPALEPHRFFPLDAILITWTTRHDNAATYMRQATTEVQAYVSLTERRTVLDWLEAKIPDPEKLASLAQESTTPKSPPPSTLGLPPVSPSKQEGTSAAPRVAGTKRSYVPDAADLDAVKKIRANEIELRDRNTVLRGVKINNFSQIKDFVVQLKSAAKGGKGPALSTISTGTSGKPGNKKSRNFPIIMVSSSPTALLTLHNIKKFLEESEYESSDIARQRNGGKTEDMIPIYRKRTHIAPGGKETETRIKYFAVDGTDALAKFSNHDGSDPWDRVVCVMTTGQEWQFKPYKWTEPRQLFHNVKGVYFQWTIDPPNPRTKDWNVSELKIDQFKRHVDKSVVAQFWRLLDAWMTTHKPSLLL